MEALGLLGEWIEKGGVIMVFFMLRTPASATQLQANPKQISVRCLTCGDSKFKALCGSSSKDYKSNPLLGNICKYCLGLRA